MYTNPMLTVHPQPPRAVYVLFGQQKETRALTTAPVKPAWKPVMILTLKAETFMQRSGCIAKNLFHCACMLDMSVKFPSREQPSQYSLASDAYCDMTPFKSLVVIAVQWR